MIRGWKQFFFATVSVVGLLPSTFAAAQIPSALVLEKKGATSPEVQPYTEVSVGKTITLSPKAKIVFQHYYSCRTVTVVGGTVEFETKAYFIKGGKKESETKSPCPKTVTLKAGGEAGGILMRSMLARSDLTFSNRPQFVLVGKRAHEFASVRFSQSGTVVLNRAIESRHFQWPSQAQPLTAGGDYELELIPSDSDSPPVTHDFNVSRPVPNNGSGRIILIRID